MSRHEGDDLGVSYVHREIEETKRRRSTNQKIRSVYVRMVSSSASKQTVRMDEEQGGTMRKKDCNMVLFLLFILLPLFFSVALTAFVALCKLGSAVGTADISLV